MKVRKTNKTVLLIATGGTIASVENECGLAPGLTGTELAQAVPELSDLCNIDVVQLMNIDSTNMTPANWQAIAACITENYERYDGFVILHGTDTMSYTAAALSYLIQDSPKPIVLTGSQRPMQNPFTDAKLNLFQSFVYATDEDSCGVVIVFAGSVIAGTRARKQRTMSHNAFCSINFPELAMVRDAHVLRPSEVKRQDAHPRFYTELNDRVCVLKLTPGVRPSVFKALAADYDAVIVETFGMGGIPDHGPHNDSFKEAIYEWTRQGKLIVLTTQVPEEGCDMGVYEVGRAYTQHTGILRGDDMTTEALVAKTMWVLAYASTFEETENMFYQPINHDRVGV